jgi:hypothetical protein
LASTVLLNPSTWDLMIDANRNIAVAAAPYALAQDAASAIKLFKGEDYYDTTRGVPYWQEILGQFPPLALIKARWNAAAKTVPLVTDAQTFINSITQRDVSGQVQITDVNGGFAVVSF